MNKTKKDRLFLRCLTQVSLFCLIVAILLLTLGIYMYVNDEMAWGVTNSNRYGVGRDGRQYIPYWFVIGLGIFFLVFPASDFVQHIRRSLKKKD